MTYNSRKLTQTVFSNTHDGKRSPAIKQWYGVIDYEKANSEIVQYPSKIRSEAVSYFEEQARLSKGSLGAVGVL